jgi:uncharacterized protein YyaL (SSP411 family)
LRIVRAVFDATMDYSCGVTVPRIFRFCGALVLFLLPALGACDSCSKEPALVAPSNDAGAPMRTPAEIRKDGNHLVGESSLYLREHAHNPVDWYPWTPETLERAKKLDRPIFLSVGYASCHWCHVMETEVFEHDDVALVLNESFVAIKVDREERPDVDATYMEAVQTMTGSGGWPATIFLTPDLKPFFGGTYFPHERFLEIAQNAAKEFRDNRGALDERSAQVYARLARSNGKEAVADRLRPLEIQGLAERSLPSIDEAWGGMKGRMKFPSPAKWLFLLHAARKWGAPYIEPVVRTLDNMASGGLFDHVGGGFFRYTTDATWTVPHFEKMLYVNASLARLYLEAYVAFGDKRYLLVAQRTLDFVAREMRSADGGFFASFDADSGGKEGAYYVFTTSELRALFGDDGAAVATLVGATDAGNFEGANVLTLRGPVAVRIDSRRWEAIRSKLADARDKRVRPTRDDKIVTSWNGLAIDAFARAFALTGEVRYREAATTAAEHLWRAHRHDGKLARTSTSGRTAGDGVLEDYAAYASGLLTLAEATGDTRELEHAVELAHEMRELFSNPDGGFFSTRAGGPLARRVELFDSEEPCGVAVALATHSRLAALTGQPELYAVVDNALQAHASTARRAGLGMASWLDAALLDAGPFYDVVIAGPPGAASTMALANAWRALSPAWAVRTEVGAEGAEPPLLALLPALAGKVGRGGSALAYVCVHGACQKPTTDPAALRAQLLDGWMR